MKISMLKNNKIVETIIKRKANSELLKIIIKGIYVFDEAISKKRTKLLKAI